MDPTTAPDHAPHVVVADTTFAVVPTWLIGTVNSRAVHLYAILARHANAAQEAWPSRTTLATRMGCSTDTVDRALRSLVTAGALTITRRWTVTGEPTTSLYHVHVMPGGTHPQVAANLRPGSRTSADKVAAPVRHRTKAIERENNPPTPAAAAAGEPLPAHHGQHRACRACGTSPRQLAEVASQPAARPPWCGHCDEATRLMDDEPTATGGAVVRRCTTCHPLEIGA